MSDFNRQEIPKEIFQTPNKVILPKFKKIYHYISKDGKTEIDAIGENKVKWAVEIKWKEKITGLKLLQDFYKKTKPLADTLWVISKSGFTSEAIEFARKNNILLSDNESLKKLKSYL